MSVPKDPVTVEATLWRKFSDRLVAMCRSGLIYTWFIPKGRAPRLSEGDLVYVTYDPDTLGAFHMSLICDEVDLSSALDGEP